MGTPIFCKYMIRTSEFERANSGRSLYIAQGGQNYQLLLPVLYNNTVHVLEEPLFYCVVREDSHSHVVVNDTEAHLERCDEHEKTVIGTIKRMQIPEEQELIEIVKEKYKNRKDDIRKKAGMAEG